jgi:hypothetical protein
LNTSTAGRSDGGIEAVGTEVGAEPGTDDGAEVGTEAGPELGTDEGGAVLEADVDEPTEGLGEDA